MSTTQHVTITHTAAEGTLLHGDPRPHQAILKTAGWRWSRNLDAWYVPRSRDALPHRSLIESTKNGLEAAGLTVAVDLDDTPRSFDEIDGDRADRAAARAAGLDAKADRLHAEADTYDQRFRDQADMIPMGQPILVDHYSARRHRNAIAKMQRDIGKSVEAYKEATETERRADASRANQARKESVPAMIRRAERLEADSRKLTRDFLTPCRTSNARLKEDAEPRTEMQCRLCWQTVPVVTVDGRQVISSHGSVIGTPAETDYRSRVARLDEEAAHLRRKVAEAAEAGVKVWGPDDFKPGDMVEYWGGRREVVRVNRKTLTVKSDYSWTDKVPFDKVRGRVDASTS